MTDAEKAKLRINSLAFLAPAMRRKAQNVLDRMTARGHDPYIFETMRVASLQVAYFAEGVSKQKDVLRGMHAYGLAFDVVSKANGWNYSPAWKKDLAEACKAEGLTCGGEWKTFVDWPHVQWGKYAGAPSDALVAAYNTGGLYAAWAEAGAL